MTRKLWMLSQHKKRKSSWMNIWGQSRGENGRNIRVFACYSQIGSVERSLDSRSWISSRQSNALHLSRSTTVEILSCFPEQPKKKVRKNKACKKNEGKAEDDEQFWDFEGILWITAEILSLTTDLGRPTENLADSKWRKSTKEQADRVHIAMNTLSDHIFNGIDARGRKMAKFLENNRKTLLQRMCNQQCTIDTFQNDRPSLQIW
jgi:hypothetical protein